MADDTTVNAIDTPARRAGIATVAHGTDVTVTFGAHLDSEISNRSSNTRTATGKTAVRNLDLATPVNANPENSLLQNNQRNTSELPLYERLYGSHTASQSGQLANQLETLSDSGRDSAATHRIRDFAKAIRAPASIAAMELGTSTNTIIAFAGLETGWGQHIPGTGNQRSNNLFGIKANLASQPSVTSATSEFIDGEKLTIDQQFRSYQSIGESISDFSRFLRNNPRYEEALMHADNPEQFISKVHEAGYATDPDYANKVIAALQQLENITTLSGKIGIGWR